MMEQAIEATTIVPAAHKRVEDVLVDDPGSVLAESTTPEQRRTRRFRSELRVSLGGGANVTQEVEIQVEPPGSNVPFTLPLNWRATAHEALSPTFVGTLRVSPDRAGTLLTLTGTYRVPLGGLGRIVDRISGRKLAHASLVAFLDGVARRLHAEVERRLGTPMSRPAPFSIRIDDEIGTENYLG